MNKISWLHLVLIFLCWNFQPELQETKWSFWRGSWESFRGLICIKQIFWVPIFSRSISNGWFQIKNTWFSRNILDSVWTAYNMRFSRTNVLGLKINSGNSYCGCPMICHYFPSGQKRFTAAQGGQWFFILSTF